MVSSEGLIDRRNARGTAPQEVSEETGLKGRIIEKLGEISYWYYLKKKYKVQEDSAFFSHGI
jgi:hypothetical protein